MGSTPMGLQFVNILPRFIPSRVNWCAHPIRKSQGNTAILESHDPTGCYVFGSTHHQSVNQMLDPSPRVRPHGLIIISFTYGLIIASCMNNPIMWLVQFQFFWACSMSDDWSNCYYWLHSMFEIDNTDMCKWMKYYGTNALQMYGY